MGRVIVPARLCNSSATESSSRTLTLALRRPFLDVGWVMLAPKQGRPPRPQRRNLYQVLRPEQPAPAVEEFYFYGHVLAAPVAAHDLAHRPPPGVDSVVLSHPHPRTDACLPVAQELTTPSRKQTYALPCGTCTRLPPRESRGKPVSQAREVSSRSRWYLCSRQIRLIPGLLLGGFLRRRCLLGTNSAIGPHT